MCANIHYNSVTRAWMGRKWFLYMPSGFVVFCCTDAFDCGVNAHRKEVETYICLV